mgnify:CR=1 FL=1
MGIKRPLPTRDTYDTNGHYGSNYGSAYGSLSDVSTLPSNQNASISTNNQAEIHKEMTKRDKEKTKVTFVDQKKTTADQTDDETGPIVQIIENTDKKWAVSLKVAKIFIDRPENIKVKVSKKTITIRSQIDHNSKVSYLKVIFTKYKKKFVKKYFENLAGSSNSK